MTTAGVEAGADPGRKAPGRPRDARADDAILDALIAMLGEGQSPAAISIEAVAARAGVGKATIYRRWPNKEALLIDAAARMKGPPPVPNGISVRDDLVSLVVPRHGRKNEQYSKAAACLMPEIIRNPTMHAVYQAIFEPRRKVMREVLQRGVDNGELRPDLDIELTLLLLNAPPLAQNAFNLIPAVPREGFAEKLVDLVLRGAAS